MSGSSADEDTSSSREGVDDAAFITPGREADSPVPSLGLGTVTLSEEEEADAYSSSAAGSPPVQGAIKAPKKSPPAADDAKGGASEQRRDELSSRAGEIVPNLPIRSQGPLGQRTLASREQIQNTISIVENLRQQLDETISTVDAMKRQIDQSGSDVNEMKEMLQSFIALQQGAAAFDNSSTPPSPIHPSSPPPSSLSQTVTSRESSSNNSPSSTGARTATVGSTELTHHSFTPGDERGGKSKGSAGDRSRSDGGAEKGDRDGNGTATPANDAKRKGQKSINPFKHDSANLMEFEISGLNNGRAFNPKGKHFVPLTGAHLTSALIEWISVELEEKDRRNDTGFSPSTLLTLASHRIETVFKGNKAPERTKALKKSFLNLLGTYLGIPIYAEMPSAMTEEAYPSLYEKEKTIRAFNSKRRTFVYEGITHQLSWREAVQTLFIDQYLSCFIMRDKVESDLTQIQDSLTAQVENKTQQLRAAFKAYIKASQGYKGERVSLILRDLKSLMARRESAGGNGFKAACKHVTQIARGATPSARPTTGIWFELGQLFTKKWRECNNFWAIELHAIETFSEVEQRIFGTQSVFTSTDTSETQFNVGNTTGTNTGFSGGRANNRNRSNRSGGRNNPRSGGNQSSTNVGRAFLNACVSDNGGGEFNNLSRDMSTMVCNFLENGLTTPVLHHVFNKSTTTNPAEKTVLNFILHTLSVFRGGRELDKKNGQAIIQGRRLLALEKASQYNSEHGDGSSVTTVDDMQRFLTSQSTEEQKLKERTTSNQIKFFDPSEPIGSQWISNIPDGDYKALEPRAVSLLRILRLWHNTSKKAHKRTFGREGPLGKPAQANYGRSKLQEASVNLGSRHKFTKNGSRGGNRGGGHRRSGNRSSNFGQVNNLLGGLNEYG